MDCNNYSYAPHMLDEDVATLMNYETPEGYGSLTLERWHSDRNKITIVTKHFRYSEPIDLCDYETVDITNITEFSDKLRWAIRLYLLHELN